MLAGIHINLAGQSLQIRLPPAIAEVHTYFLTLRFPNTCQAHDFYIFVLLNADFDTLPAGSCPRNPKNTSFLNLPSIELFDTRLRQARVAKLAGAMSCLGTYAPYLQTSLPRLSTELCYQAFTIPSMDRPIQCWIKVEYRPP